MEEGTENNNQNKLTYRDRPFNGWRVPRSAIAQGVVADVVNQLLNYEKRFKLRERKRRPKDQETFERSVSAIICDLIYQHLVSGPEQWVYVTQSNEVLGRKSRYRSVVLNTTLPDLLKRLSSPEMGFIQFVKGEVRPFGKSHSTTIKAGPRLIAQINAHDLTPHDLGKEPGAEVIHLKREKDDYWDDGGLVEYTDTSTTALYRHQVEEINTWLDSMDIEFNDLVLDNDDKVVDTLDRSLRRIFTKGEKKFDHGGRLFGGFWQGLRKKERFDGLYLNDERIVELDYGQMGPRILYGMCGATPPEHDAYTLPALKGQYRKGVKKVFNALVFNEKPISRKPKGVKKLIPERYSIHEVVRAIKEVHPEIAVAFGTGIGHQVQFHESQILVALLLRLKDEDIPALPIHDAVLVPHFMKDDAKRIMLEVFKDQTGVEGIVTEETGSAQLPLNTMKGIEDMRDINTLLHSRGHKG